MSGNAVLFFFNVKCQSTKLIPSFLQANGMRMKYKPTSYNKFLYTTKVGEKVIPVSEASDNSICGV